MAQPERPPWGAVVKKSSCSSCASWFKVISSFLCQQRNEAKKLPLNSCVFPRSLAKAGAESKHSAYIPSFAHALGAAITGGVHSVKAVIPAKAGIHYPCDMDAQSSWA